MAIAGGYPYPQQFGGGGGSAFNDVTRASTKKIVGPASITIWHGSRVDAIEVTYRLAEGGVFKAPRHGGTGGNATTINLGVGEQIIALAGRSGSAIDQLSFLTRDSDGKKKTYGPYGGGGGSPFRVDGVVMAFFGRSGSQLDEVGVYLNGFSSELHGGDGGSPFTDPTLVKRPAVVEIAALTVRHGSDVNSIRARYRLTDGSIWQAPAHGGSGGSATTISLERGEKIIAVVGRSGNRVDQLSFLTEKASGERRTFGPFGGSGGSPFIVNGNVTGVFGRSGGKLDAVGFFLESPDTSDLTIYGANGYRYCVLTHAQQVDTCTVPVQSGAADLSFTLSLLGVYSAGVSFEVTGPDGTVYDTQSSGDDGVWALAAVDAQGGAASSGLQTFYVQNPAPGSWTARVTSQVDVNWSLLGATNPPDTHQTAQSAFERLPPDIRNTFIDALRPPDDEIPLEFCYFCQAQMMVIMGLMVATFVLLAGPVTPTSAVVLYAERLLGASAASLVANINNLRSVWQTGTQGWNLARTLCQWEGFCPES